MSVADIMNDLGVIEQQNIITTNHTFKNGNNTYLHSVDTSGSYHITAADGGRLLSFNNDNSLSDCTISAEIVNVAALANGAIGALEEQAIIIDSLQERIASLELQATATNNYVNALQSFFNDFKESIYISNSSGAEIDYNNLL